MMPFACAATLPVWIEPNRGQFAPGIEFAARSGAWQAGLRGGGVVLDGTNGEQVRMLFEGSRALRPAEPEGAPQPAMSSYFHGNDPTKWITGVPHYSRIRYRDVYPGIDLVYYGSANGKLEYDFELSPMADSSRIRLRFDGAARIESTASGDLKIFTASGRYFVQRAPRVFEERGGGVRREVAARFRMEGALGARFEIARREWKDSKLIVDPVLEYATFAGGPAFDSARALACDNNGNCYLAGEGRSRNGLVGPMQSSANGGQEVVVVKINHQTNTLGYYAVIGGDMDDIANAVAVDAMGAVYIGGTTKSLNFPTRSAAQPNPGGPLFSDAFVAKLSPDGSSLQYSTYVGGSGAEEGRGLTIDRAGAAYLVGSTGSRESFPLTPGAFQTGFRGSLLGQSATGFVTKIHPSGSRWAYSTLFGGSRQDDVRAAAVDDAGQLVIIGTTTSIDLPLRNAWQRQIASSLSGFAARLSAEGSETVFSTYFGGVAVNSLFGGIGITLDAVTFDAAGNIVIGGATSSGFPVKDGAQGQYGGGRSDGFVANLSGSGSDLLWFSYLGGSEADGVSALALHRDGSIGCAGYTASLNFPLRFSAQQPGGRIDAFVARLSASSGALVSSSLLGGAEEDRALGLAVDGSDSALVAGWTASTDFPFPRQGGGVQSTYGGGAGDMFFARLGPDSGGLDAVPQPLQTSTSVAAFTSTVGATRPPAPAALQITSASGQAVGFTVEWSSNQAGNWLSAGPQRAETPATINVFVNPSGLAPGTYLGVVRLVPVSGGLPVLVNVSYQVLNRAAELYSLAPAWLAAGSGDFEVTLRGRGFAQGATVRMAAEDANGTTTMTPTSMGPNSLSFLVPRSLIFRDSSFEIRVSNPDAEVSNPVSLLVGGRTAKVLPASVVHAATGIAGPIAPGQMLVITGQGMGPAEFARPEANDSVLGTRAGGVRVLFGGLAAPLQFASDKLICAMAPYAISQQALTEMTVEYNGERSVPISLQVVATQPGILTAESVVVGYGAVRNETGAENSNANPARRGSLLSFVMTGAGMLAQGSDGRLGLAGNGAVALLPVSVTLDGRDAELVAVSELAGQASGLVLVRIRVPQAARSGEVPLAVKAGDLVSPPVRTFVE